MLTREWKRTHCDSETAERREERLRRRQMRTELGRAAQTDEQIELCRGSKDVIDCLPSQSKTSRERGQATADEQSPVDAIRCSDSAGESPLRLRYWHERHMARDT